MDAPINVKLAGGLTQQGKVWGRGKLTIEADDATDVTMSVAAGTGDSVVLRLESRRGFKLGADRSLNVSGGIRHDVLNDQLTGRAAVELEVSKDVALHIQQQFDEAGGSTSAGLKIRI